MTFRLQLAWRYLWGRKWRTALTTLAIVLGVMIIFGMNGLAPVMKASLDESIAASAHQVDLIVTHKTGGIFDQSLADVVRRTPGVAVVAPALNLPVLLPPGYTLQPVSGGRPVDRLGVNGWEPAAALKATPLNPVAGRWLAPEDANAIVVRESLAQKTGLTLGDSLQLPSAGGVTRFEVVGILPASPVLGEEKVYITLAAAQRLFNRPGQINGIGAQFKAGEEGDAVRRAVLARLGPDFEGGDVSAGGNEWESFFRMVNLMTTTLGLLALAMGGFIMFITFRTAVTERKQDAGMLRAVGASRRAVTGLVLTEGIIQGTAGTAAGLLAGYLLAKMLVRLFDPIWDEIMHTSLGDPVFTPQTVALAIGFGLGVPLIGVWLPALSAGRVTPLEALRPAVGVVERQLWGWQTGLGAGLIVLALAGAASGRERLISAGALVFLIGLAVTGPALVRPASTVLGRLLEPVFAAEGHLARRNLARRPGRAAITALTIAISLAILITLAGFSTTMGKGMTGWLETSMGANYLFLPQNLLLGRGNVEAGPELAQRLRRTPGIAAVTTLRRSETQFNGAALQVIGIDPETYPEVSGLAFSAGEPEQAYIKLAQGRYLVANGIFAAAHTLRVGDEVALQTASGVQTYQIVGVGIDYLNGTVATAYISQANMARDFHQRNDFLLLANRAPEAAPQAVEEALLQLVRAYPAFSLISYDRWRASQMELINLRNYSTNAMMVMLAVPALIALVNTLGINVLERTREIGVLRAIGGARRQVQRMVVAESLLLAALGIAAGILAGIWLGYITINAMKSTGFPYDYYFPYAGILLAVAAGLLLGVLAALLPARHAARLNVVDALHYE